MVRANPPQREEFAYGCNHYGVYACPAIAAGREPKEEDAVLGVAEFYDEHATQYAGDTGGLLPAEQAKEAWDKAIAEIDERRNAADTKAEGQKYDGMYYAARDIARELGWWSQDR